MKWGARARAGVVRACERRRRFGWRGGLWHQDARRSPFSYHCGGSQDLGSGQGTIFAASCPASGRRVDARSAEADGFCGQGRRRQPSAGRMRGVQNACLCQLVGGVRSRCHGHEHSKDVVVRGEYTLWPDPCQQCHRCDQKLTVGGWCGAAFTVPSDPWSFPLGKSSVPAIHVALTPLTLTLFSKPLSCGRCRCNDISHSGPNR